MDILDVYFDQKLHFDDGKNVKSFTSSNFTWDMVNTNFPANSIPICMGRSFANCPRLPTGLLALVGMFKFECLNDAIISPLPSQGKVITYTPGYGMKKEI